MSIQRISRMVLFLIYGLLFILPVTAAAREADAAQIIPIADTRSGTGPCGFIVQREIEGTVSVSSWIDESGQLVLSITSVDLRGTLSNPANGNSVEISWIDHDSSIAFTESGISIDVVLGLTATINRGYDTGDSRLTMDLPVDGVEVLEFTPGERSENPWAHVCGQLA